MDRVSAAATPQVSATTTSYICHRSAQRHIPTPSELVVSGKDISSETCYQFMITDSEDDSDDALQIATEEAVTPSKPSIKPFMTET